MYKLLINTIQNHRKYTKLCTQIHLLPDAQSPRNKSVFVRVTGIDHSMEIVFVLCHVE